MKKGIAVGIIALFIVSIVSPMVIGYEAETDVSIQESPREIYSDFNRFNKYYYPEGYLPGQYLIEEDSNDWNSEGVTLSEKNIYKPKQPILHNGLMNSSWPMHCHDARHTGRSPYSTVNTWDEIWRIEFNSLLMLGSPAIDKNGTIYCSSQGEFYAVYPNGTLKWKYDKMSGYPWCTPAIDENNTIYFGTIYGYPSEYLYAFYPNGTLKWKIKGDHIRSSPAIGSDGTIYYADAYSKRLRSVSPNGTVKWTFNVNHHIYSDIAIGLDGTIYFGTIEDKKVYAVWPNGTLKWKFNTGTWVHGSASIGDDGTVYIGSDKMFYAFYPNNGTVKWSLKLGAIWSTPVIDENGIIYVGSNNGKLYALYQNGTIKWSFSTGGHFWFGTSPALSAEGTIYFGTTSFGGGSGNFFALFPNGTIKWQFTKGYYETSPAIGENGIVYITSCYGGDGALHAFGKGEVIADAYGPYYGLINEPIQFNGSAFYGYPPYSWHWEFGDGNTSDEQNPKYSYTNPGNFSATLTVTDDSGNTSNDTTWAWIQEINNPPDKPTIDGKTLGKTYSTYDYTFVTSDSDGTNIYYYVDWGDGTTTGWIGPFSSGKEIIISNRWSNKGSYIVRVKAEDPYNAESEWEELTVNITELTLQIKNRFIFVTAEISNTGNYDLSNITWRLKVSPWSPASEVIFPKRQLEGTMLLLKAGQMKRVRTPIIGFRTIEVWAYALNQAYQKILWAYGPFIFPSPS